MTEEKYDSLKIDTNEKAVIKAILYNARKTTKEISKETGITRQTVSNIIKKLEDKGGIWGYSTVTEPELLGDHFYLLLIKFKEDIDVRDIFKKAAGSDLVEKMTKGKFRYSTYLHGRFDFITSFYASDIFEAEKVVNNLLKPFRKYFSEVYIHQALITFRRMGIVNPKLKQDINNLF
jgi:DNA-binding Lrp family transcriptional regulator